MAPLYSGVNRLSLWSRIVRAVTAGSNPPPWKSSMTSSASMVVS